ncbi:hypothetical protein EDM02_05355 [Candidatus Cardinium hertigii]|uniref:Uncharacterized protein n=1 Tax=Candidatus Cardinium hertigii TaxID=247481 RepID=A0A3N2QBL8_9BACT|nr:hypothetical protein EDM02_05355 [Candidatus Cardinium hertigii]
MVVIKERRIFAFVQKIARVVGPLFKKIRYMEKAGCIKKLAALESTLFGCISIICIFSFCIWVLVAKGFIIK